MNQVEQVLNEELGCLMDRLASSVPDGALGALSAKSPALRRRLDEVESQIATLRASLLEGYGQWRRILEDVENLWALAAWRSGSEETAHESTSLAA
jgi:hypothetical protein